MKLTTTQIAIIGAVVLVVVTVVLLFTGVIPGLRRNTSTGISGNLTVWGVFDNEQTIRSTLIGDFVTANPNVKITYKQFDPNTYEQDLVNALAAGNGPDIFMLKNTWLTKHADKIAPLGTDQLTVPALRTLFPDVVTADFTANDQIYALPLYIDTLALLYNKTLFDNAGIALPPTTWEEFQALLPKLRIIDQTGRIVRAAAAIGSGNNINQSTDLLNLLMIQRGASMTNADATRATFATDKGRSAVTYYTDFANPRSNLYTWDTNQHYSLDAFAEENVAMIFNYAYQMALIKEKNPFLNFSAAPMLQWNDGGTQKNFANYLGLTVSNKSAQKDLAWAFIMSSTLNKATNVKYLNATSRPPALREVITLTLNDPEIGIFSRQALTATSWQKVDDVAVDNSFVKMINLIINGQLSVNTAVQQAEAEITSLMQRRTTR